LNKCVQNKSSKILATYISRYMKRTLEQQDEESGQKRIKLNDTTRCCSTCKESKPLDQYNTRPDSKSGLKSQCKSCESITRKKYQRTQSGFLKTLVRRARRVTGHASVRNQRGRNLTSTLTEDKLKEIIKKQDGKCAISNAVLVFKSFSNNQASVDRINDDLGYVDGNCRVVCLEFNTSVKWSRALLLKSIALSGIPPENFESEISNLEIVHRRGGRNSSIERKWVLESRNGIAVIFCHYCSETKPRNDFYELFSSGCKTCIKQRQKDCRYTWRGALKLLILSARSHTESRNKRRKKGSTEDKVELTYKELVGILKKQGGMCAYSRVALSPKMGDWKASLERKDVNKGYSAGNVLLVCQRFNGIDCTRLADKAVDGSGGWTREKFLQYAALVSA